MLAMPALFHHPSEPPASHNHSFCELDEVDAYIALQAISSDSLLPTQSGEKGATRRRYSIRATEAFSCDDFRMYEYKVRRCMRGRSHDWTDCPFAHPGEKARRRDPRKVHYSGSPCPEFRKGSCRRGDVCEFAHGVFECYLHPARYRTQACKDGRRCRRRVCFFAHTLEELRHVAEPTEDSLAKSVFMVDSYTDEMRLPSHAVSMEHGSSLVVLEDSFPFYTDFVERVSAHGEYANVANHCEALSVLTLPSQDSLPSEVVRALGFPSGMGLPSNKGPMIHPSSPNVPAMAQRPSSASFPMGAMFQNCSPTSELPSLSPTPALRSPTFESCLHVPYLVGLSSSPKGHATMHLSYLEESSLQQTAELNTMLMTRVCYGGGECPLSAREKAFSDMVHFGEYAGDATPRHGYLDGFGFGKNEVNEVEKVSVRTQSAASGKEMYEFLNYNGYASYGLPSPTSTLEGPLSSLPSSPPLSPLSSSGAADVCSMRGDNLLRDSTSCEGDVFFWNIVKESEINTTLTDQQSQHEQNHSRHYKWRPLCDYQYSGNTDKCDLLQHMLSDVSYNSCGEVRGESPEENAMPDLGWVNDLVM